MKRFLRLGVNLGMSAAVLLTAATSLARVTWNLKPAGMGDYDWTLKQHWEFNRTGASSSLGNCVQNCNYHSYGADEPDVSWGTSDPNGNNRTAAPECLEIQTYAGIITANPDTVIDVKDQNGTWQLVNDDFGGGGSRISRARIWIDNLVTTMTFHMRIRAYSSVHNSDDFYVTTTRRDFGANVATARAACTSGQTTIPWVQVTDSPTSTVTFSSFH